MSGTSRGYHGEAHSHQCTSRTASSTGHSSRLVTPKFYECTYRILGDSSLTTRILDAATYFHLSVANFGLGFLGSRKVNSIQGCHVCVARSAVGSQILFTNLLASELADSWKCSSKSTPSTDDKHMQPKLNGLLRLDPFRPPLKFVLVRNLGFLDLRFWIRGGYRCIRHHIKILRSREAQSEAGSAPPSDTSRS